MIEIFTNVKLKAGATKVSTISSLFNSMGWLSNLWFVCDGTVRFWYKGPVQTSNFSCAEPNYQIKVLRMNQLASTDLYLDRPASRIERQKLDIHCDVEPSNAYIFWLAVWWVVTREENSHKLDDN